MKKEIIKILIVVVILVLAGWGIGSFLDKDDTGTLPEEKIMPEDLSQSESPQIQIDQTKTYMANMKTTKGDMMIELFADKVPVTVNSFVVLAKEGFYKNVKIHRIVKDFMIQSGDPTGTGTGGPGYMFDDEPFEGEYTRGTLAMANAGPNTNGSQFFIIHKNYPLPPNYVIFGKLTSGLDTLDAIAESPVQDNGMGEISSPIEDVLIESIEIVEK